MALQTPPEPAGSWPTGALPMPVTAKITKRRPLTAALLNRDVSPDYSLAETFGRLRRAVAVA
jgi:hypothetical protein